jgi:protein required for attachment to host cells
MTIRLVLADQSEARFYNVAPIGGEFHRVGTLSDSKAHQHGSAAHHTTGSEETPRQHEAHVFASRIVDALETARNAHEFDRLVVIAGPHFMGLLRELMPKPLSALVVTEVVKDLMHETDDVVRSYLPISVVSARA